MAKLELKVDGMHCTSCEVLIKDALEGLPGLTNVEASYSSGIVSVEFDESKTTCDEIIKTIKKEGYEIDN